MFDGFQCGVRSLTKYHDKVTAQQQRTRNNFGNRLFLAIALSDINPVSQKLPILLPALNVQVCWKEVSLKDEFKI
ncbi:MAG: hypothetical protein ACYTX0_41460 [Nostoc sp.]